MVLLLQDLVAVDVAVVTDQGIAIDLGIVTDLGIAKDQGIAKDLGIARDLGIAIDLGIARDLGIAIDPGIGAQESSGYYGGCVCDPATRGAVGVAVLVGGDWAVAISEIEGLLDLCFGAGFLSPVGHPVAELITPVREVLDLRGGVLHVCLEQGSPVLELLAELVNFHL